MKAVVYRGVSHPLAVETVPDPTPRPDEVVLKVLRAGICGSDLHMASLGKAAPGTIFGHEFSGEIVAKGRDVALPYGFGDIVTANPYDSCRTCEVCGEGHMGLCSVGVCVGTDLDRPGAYAEYLAVKAHMLHRLPSGVSMAEGAMVEPLTVAYHTVHRAALRPDDDVLIMGGGPIGAAVTLFARLAGARNIVVSEPSEVRRQGARDFGATGVIDPTKGPLAELAARQLGAAPSVVIECVGTPGRIQDAMTAVKIKGRVIIPGVCMEEDRFYPVIGIMKELDLQFSQTATDSDFEAVIDLIAKREIEPLQLLTRTISLGEVDGTFQGLTQDPSQIKVLIDPSLA